MLADSRMFERVESILQGNGSFQRFEDENGPIRGRMMITQTEIPKNVEVMARDGAAPIAFEASFDFYESTVGLALIGSLQQACGQRRRGTEQNRQRMIGLSSS